jgi:hypothetical protein
LREAVNLAIRYRLQRVTATVVGRWWGGVL